MTHGADGTYVDNVTCWQCDMHGQCDIYGQCNTCRRGGLWGHFRLLVSLSHKGNILLPSAPIKKLAECSRGYDSHHIVQHNFQHKCYIFALNAANTHLNIFSLFNIFDAALIRDLNSPQYTSQPDFIFSSNIWVYLTQKD